MRTPDSLQFEIKSIQFCSVYTKDVRKEKKSNLDIVKFFDTTIKKNHDNDSISAYKW